MFLEAYDYLNNAICYSETYKRKALLYRYIYCIWDLESSGQEILSANIVDVQENK